jgi:predicted Zn-ribbon and HTH transcriptional regulator
MNSINQQLAEYVSNRNTAATVPSLGGLKDRLSICSLCQHNMRGVCEKEDRPVQEWAAYSQVRCVEDKWTESSLHLSAEAFKFSVEPGADTQTSTSSSLPSIGEMGKSFAYSITNWAKSGFQVPEDEIYNTRLAICKTCDQWDAEAFMGTGRCNKCGCSTQAKLRMATEKCPIDKWGPVTLSPSEQQPTTN